MFKVIALLLTIALSVQAQNWYSYEYSSTNCSGTLLYFSSVNAGLVSYSGEGIANGTFICNSTGIYQTLCFDATDCSTTNEGVGGLGCTSADGTSTLNSCGAQPPSSITVPTPSLTQVSYTSANCTAAPNAQIVTTVVYVDACVSNGDGTYETSKYISSNNTIENYVCTDAACASCTVDQTAAPVVLNTCMSIDGASMIVTYNSGSTTTSTTGSTTTTTTGSATAAGSAATGTSTTTSSASALSLGSLLFILVAAALIF